MSQQKFCVIEYWRGTVNGVFGPFSSAEAACRFMAQRLEERGGERDTITLHTRLLTGGDA